VVERGERLGGGGVERRFPRGVGGDEAGEEAVAEVLEEEEARFFVRGEDAGALRPRPVRWRAMARKGRTSSPRSGGASMRTAVSPLARCRRR
jgi:hypothetical protein